MSYWPAVEVFKSLNDRQSGLLYLQVSFDFSLQKVLSCFKKIERRNQDYKPMSSVAAFLTENLFVEKLTNEEAYKGAAGFRWSVYLWPYCNPQTHDFFIERVRW